MAVKGKGCLVRGLLGIVVVLLSVALLAAWRPVAMLDYVLPPGGSSQVDIRWKDMGDSPEAVRGYTPQGITFIDGDLVLAESWADKKNVLYVMRAGSDGYTVLRSLDMPPEAVHTSGLEWDGESLWAVDYVSNRLYRIDWRASLDAGRVVVVDSCPTGLKGTGSVARIRLDGEEMVVVSDFMNTGRTYFVPVDKAFGPGDIPAKSTASYRNAFFVQGLTARDGYLYESANTVGRDVVYKIDPVAALEDGDYAAGIVARYPAPSKMVEDLAFDGHLWWTGDEYSFKLYATDGIE